MQLTIADIVGIVLMLCAAGSRLLPLTEPFWNKLPDKLQPVIPALLLWLPQLMDLAGVATTKLDLIEMVMLTLAALTPGAHTRTRLGAKTPEVRASHRPPPNDDPPTGENPVGPQATVLPPNPRWGGPVAMVALLLIGCGASQHPRECDEAKVTAHTARCKARVALECADIPEEQLETSCPVIAQCDEELDRICPESP